MGNQKVFGLTSCLSFPALGLLMLVPATGAVVATDGDIPAVMDAGGTSGAPADYIFGVASGYTRTFLEAKTLIGESSSWNQLYVQNGASLQANELNLGQDDGSTNNSLLVSASTVEASSLSVGFYGSNNYMSVDESTLTLSGAFRVGSGEYSTAGRGDGNSAVLGNNSTVSVNSMDVGFYGDNNNLTVQGGSSLTVANTTIIGYGSSGRTTSGNSMTVTGAGTVFNVSFNLAVGIWSRDNNMFIRDGAAVTVSSGVTIGYDAVATGNTLELEGRNSTLSMLSLTLGYNGSDNNLTVMDEALVVISGGINVSNGSGEDNYIRLGGGYLAWEGDRQTELEALLAAGVLLVWNEEDGVWEDAADSDYFSYGYFLTDEEAEVFSGYENLGGHTILTSGYNVPEPAQYAALAGLLGLLALLRRRGRS